MSIIRPIGKNVEKEVECRHIEFRAGGRLKILFGSCPHVTSIQSYEMFKWPRN